MHAYYLNKYLFVFLFIILISINVKISHAKEQLWIEIEPGLKYTEIQITDNKLIYILSFDPKFFQFNLYAISEKKHNPLSLGQWAKQENLVAAINASMYLPDKITSTGYMRNKEHINNKHIAKKFGAFLVSKPNVELNSTLPTANILDKDSDNWQDLILKYEIVVQNFRLINSKKEILWKKDNQPFSISAIGKDDNGNILFIHSSYAITPYKFAMLLLQSPLNVNTVMYTEGGHQAGLLVNAPNMTKFWHGNSLVDFLIPHKIDALLPNVMGVTRK